jgi:hypothetical protein
MEKKEKKIEYDALVFGAGIAGGENCFELG